MRATACCLKRVGQCLSRMRRKVHVRFLGEGLRATSAPYPTEEGQRMPETPVGGFEYGGRGFRFHTATCQLKPGGYLYVDAVGRGCGLSLVGVPFPDAASFGELPGRVWEPDEDGLARYADVFAEGGLEVRGSAYGLWPGASPARGSTPTRACRRCPSGSTLRTANTVARTRPTAWSNAGSSDGRWSSAEHS